MANPENLEGQGFHTNPERINRSGKSKGQRNRKTIVREALEAILEGTEQQVVDAITAAAIKKAMAGDIPAFKELLDSGYGKTEDVVDHKSTDGSMSPAESRLASILKKSDAKDSI